MCFAISLCIQPWWWWAWWQWKWPHHRSLIVAFQRLVDKTSSFIDDGKGVIPTIANVIVIVIQQFGYLGSIWVQLLQEFLNQIWCWKHQFHENTQLICVFEKKKTPPLSTVGVFFLKTHNLGLYFKHKIICTSFTFESVSSYNTINSIN
jgi:hypothetical protein